MVAVSLCVEACVSMRPPFSHEIRVKTIQRYPASQPVLTSDKLLYIERLRVDLMRNHSNTPSS